MLDTSYFHLKNRTAHEDLLERLGNKPPTFNKIVSPIKMSRDPSLRRLTQQTMKPIESRRNLHATLTQEVKPPAPVTDLARQPLKASDSVARLNRSTMLAHKLREV
jgi:hypothetical protein